MGIRGRVGGARVARNDPDAQFRGMAYIDLDRKGHPTATAAVLSRSRDDRQEFDLRFVSGADGLVLSKEGELLPPFESFAVAPGDLANQKPASCSVSVRVSYLACQYWSKDLQGIVVWRLLGGAHRFEQVAERYYASSVLSSDASARLLVGTDTGLMSIADGVEAELADLPEDWRLAATEGPYVVALSPAAKKGQVFRFADGETKLTVLLEPIPAADIIVIPGTARALVQEPDRLSLVEIETRRAIWSAPIDSLRHVGFSSDSRRAVAVAAAAAYVLDIDTGRILSSFPTASAQDGPVAIDPLGRKVAYVDAGNRASVLDLTSGATQTTSDAASTATQFAWSKDSSLLLVGGTDGSVLAWDASKGLRWLISSPFAKSFQATAWPGQPPQGVVLQFALSNDGRRFAIIRQDMPTIDIHDLVDGRQLTQLTSPRSTMKVPAKVSFAANDDVLSAWAVIAMTRGKPRFVIAHRLPRNFDEAIAAATARLAALRNVWSPDGPAPSEPKK
jgi:hypothetical protein